MIPTEVIAEVQNLFGDKYEAVVKINPDLINYMNQGQVHIAKETECLQTSVQFSTTSIGADGSFACPVDLVRIKSVIFNQYALKETTFENLVNSNAAMYPTGNPTLWYKWGSKFFLYPIPPATGTNDVTMFYQQNPVVLTFATYTTAQLDLPLHMHEDLVQYMLMRCKEQNEDYQAQNAISENLGARLATNKDLSQNPSDAYPIIRDDWLNWA